MKKGDFSQKGEFSPRGDFSPKGDFSKKGEFSPKGDFSQKDRLSPHRYDDLLYLPHHKSPKRLPMPLADRAAQFAPFQALVGFDAEIEETARLTDYRIELDENKKALLDRKFQLLEESMSRNMGAMSTRQTIPPVTITYFEQDARKEGGQYLTKSGQIRKIDRYRRILCLEDGLLIPISEIIELDGELFQYLD